MQEAELEDFLFGAKRISLTQSPRVCGELAAGRCFYCRRPVQSSAAIDHFIPWTRFIDNSIENLVFAHATCNADKGAYLAAEPHIERWVARMSRPSTAAALHQLAEQKKWDNHPERIQAVARSIYLKLPDEYRLWDLDKRFTPADRLRLSRVLAGD